MTSNWATLFDFLSEPVGFDLRRDGRWRRLAMSLGVVLAAVYGPFLWELFAPVHESSGTLGETGVTFIAPGLLPTVFFFQTLIDKNTRLRFAIAGGFTLLLIAALTLIGTQNWRSRVGAAILALIFSIPASLLFFAAAAD